MITNHVFVTQMSAVHDVIAKNCPTFSALTLLLLLLNLDYKISKGQFSGVGLKPSLGPLL